MKMALKCIEHRTKVSLASQKVSLYKIYKHMTEVSKNVYINMLDEIVDKNNKT